MPQIRPQVFEDNQGLPLKDAYVYIYKVGQDFEDPLARLPLNDAKTDTQVSNPFRTNANGSPVNNTGDAVTVVPTTSATRWGMYVTYANRAPVDHYNLPVQWSDTFAAGGESSPPVDASFNNFEDATSGVKAQDLADYDFIFIRSQGGAGWENTVDGPVNSFYAHATGGAVGDPSTGTPELFYDLQGKEWAMSNISTAPYVDLPENITQTTANTDAIAVNTNEINQLKIKNSTRVVGCAITETGFVRYYGNSDNVITASRLSVGEFQIETNVSANPYAGPSANIYIVDDLNSPVKNPADFRGEVVVTQLFDANDEPNRWRVSLFLSQAAARLDAGIYFTIPINISDNAS